LKTITVEAPASSANLGPGFDVFALALARPSDKVTLWSEKSRELSVGIRPVAGATIPVVAAKNSAGAVCLAIAQDHGIEGRISVEISKGVPIGMGMGSSGASAAAAAVAMNDLFDLDMSNDDLIFFAGKGEEVASGTAHYDNVSASVLGGFVVVVGGRRPSAIRFDAPEKMSLCVVTPAVELPERKTEYARSLVPKTVELKMMVSNVANASMIVAGFARGDTGLIGRGMNDRVVEEARKSMVPGYDAARKSATEAGAAGVCISGAGPSILAVVDRGKARPGAVLDAMVSSFERDGLKADGFVTRVGDGAREIASR
jgi:homoserine kinase